MTGPIFEVFVHQKFRRLINLEAMPMLWSNYGNYCWHAPFSSKWPTSTTVHGVATQNFNLNFNPDTTVICNANPTITLNIEPDVYYVP